MTMTWKNWDCDDCQIQYKVYDCLDYNYDYDYDLSLCD